MPLLYYSVVVVKPTSNDDQMELKGYPGRWGLSLAVLKSTSPPLLLLRHLHQLHIPHTLGQRH